MGVKIKIPLYLKEIANGEAVVEVKGQTVRECIEALIFQYPALKGEILDNEGMLLLKWMVYVNKSSPSSDELSHPVKESDVIDLIPVIAGG